MKNKLNQSIEEVVKTISQERQRTNLLKNWEQKTLAFLVKYIPSWVSSDMLTGIGFSGSLIVFLSFLLATLVNNNFLLLGVFGFIVSWFGDSLDGRIAYYRKKPHKWYGFSLDLTIDWIGTILIGLGFIIYADENSKILGYIFIVLYGWEIITTLMRYKITGKYSIDSGILGPTEARVFVSVILILEVLFTGILIYISALVCFVLLIMNILDSRKLLKLAKDRDDNETQEKIT
jgi:phosphatidylglycerophosphate synthase